MGAASSPEGPKQQLICSPYSAPTMDVAESGKWTEEDTALCREAIESGIAVGKATGKPLTFADVRAQYDDYEPVRAGLVDYETFTKDRIVARPFDR